MIRQCQLCRKLFEAYKGDHRFCSTKCRSNWWMKTRRSPARCECCGRKFKALPTSAGRFCSMACTNKARRGGGWYLTPHKLEAV